MKKIHILIIIIVAIAVSIVLVSTQNTSTYANFAEALQNPDKEFHIVGKLNKAEPQVYNPQENPNLFTFSMLDNQNQIAQVHLHKSKPQDFEKSEQIVLIGKMENNIFHANDILMKCPSKYNSEQPQVN